MLRPRCRRTRGVAAQQRQPVTLEIAGSIRSGPPSCLHLRPVRPPGRGVPIPRAWPPSHGPLAECRGCGDSLNRLPLLVLAGLLVLGIAVPMSGGARLRRRLEHRAVRIAVIVRWPRGRSVTEPSATASPAPSEAPSPSPTPAPTLGLVPTPVVLVAQFRSPVSATNRSELARVLAGTSSRYEALTLVEDEAA